jgi:hypothetical protein
MDNRTIRGWKFEWSEKHSMFECRGSVYYDDEHDEAPDPKLWSATMELEADLVSEGHSAEANYSEKGWVEVMIEK